MKKTYDTAVFAAIHEAASDLKDAGVMDKNTMQCFDELCLLAGEKASAKKRLPDILKESASRKKTTND